MEIKIFNNNSMGQNVYLYGEAIIDAGASPQDMEAITEFINKTGVKVKYILVTHGHYDHLMSIEEIKALTGADIYCHEDEQQILIEPSKNVSDRHGMKISVTPDKLLKENDVINVGKASLKVIHTPGHTAGGVCFYDEENGNLFTGDTMFKGVIGRTDLPTGSEGQLVSSIKEKLLTLPDNVKVYPGHGDSTTIKDEKF